MLLTLVMVGCDHATKAVAQAALEHRGALPLLPGLLDLRYAENRDTAFSMLRPLHFQGKFAVLVALSLVGLAAVLVLWWKRRRASMLEQSAYALIVSGAVGNAIDRAGRGYVIDFIHVHRWPIFNVADIAIAVGALMLLVFSWRRGRDSSSSPQTG